MRQETGNKTTLSDRDVSIQLKLGGHSFSADTIADSVRCGDSEVLFVVETAKVTLVPKCAFEHSAAACYLDAAGLPCGAGETTVCSEMQAEVIAVMAINAEALDAIVAMFGNRAKFTTPLLDAVHDGGRNIALTLLSGVGYFRFYADTLQAAEALPLTSPDDLLFYMVSMCDALGFGKDTVIYIKSDEAAYAKLLKRYFKRVVCE